jgi:polyisoprenoid-binding protein YceI
MKHAFQMLFVMAFALLFTACGSKKGPDAEVGDAANIEAKGGQELAVDVDASSVAWIGSKVTGSSHNGKIKIQEGVLKVEGGQLVGGKFVIDMKTITVDDLQGEDAAKLVGHLSAGDFFLVDSFPTASFEIAEVTAAATDSTTHNITGNLTLRGKTNSITFPATVAITDGKVSAKANFNIDRTKWGVAFMSGVKQFGDKTIRDDINLTLNIVTK